MKSFTDELEARVVSKRGPYDLFTGERNKPISVGYFALPVRAQWVYGSLKGPSQPHLCFCLHARVWLLYFLRSMSKRRKLLWEH